MSNDNNDLTVKDVEKLDSCEEDIIDGCVCASPTISNVLVGDRSLSDAEAAELVSIDFTAEVDTHLDANYLTSFDASSEDLSGTTDQRTVDLDETEKIVEEDSNEVPQLILRDDDSLVEEQIEVNLNMESDAEFVMNTSTIRKDNMIRESSNPFDSKIQMNPFDDDDAETCGEECHSIVSSSNPFDRDEEDTETAGSDSGITAKRIPITERERSVVGGKTVLLKIGKDKEKEPLNPFCDGDIEDEISGGKKQTLGDRKLTAESAVYTTSAPIESSDRKNVKVPSSTFHSQHHSTETNQKIMFPREVNELRSLGFEPACVTRTLKGASGDVVAARKLLLSTLFDNKTGFSNDEVCVWKSPIIVRVGGWLPNVKDEAGATHTSFYINVTMTLGNESWRIGRRYSEFYKFYSTIYNQLCKSFPNGMKNIFPSDRLSNWLSLTNQETINDSRRKSLDAWFKELVNNPALMLHDATRKVVYSFLEVDENMAKIVKTSEIVKPTRPIPTHSPSNIAKIPPSIPIPSTAITRPVTSHSSAGSGMPTDRSVRGVSPPPLPLLPAPSSIASSEEDLSFAARKKSALAAQNNDYHSPLSFGPETSTPSTSKHGTEPSTSGFSDESYVNSQHSRSFAKRVGGTGSSHP